MYPGRLTHEHDPSAGLQTSSHPPFGEPHGKDCSKRGHGNPLWEVLVMMWRVKVFVPMLQFELQALNSVHAIERWIRIT